jgi:hypothetical protein
MTENLRQTAKEEIAKLPKDAQDIINSVDWAGITEEIGRKINLTDEEINDLQVEMLLVLVGLTNPDLFTLNIENEVGTSKQGAEKIADEIMARIITPMVDMKTKKTKEELKNKEPHWQQNLNFILSGGDYSMYAEPIDRENKTADNVKPSQAPASKMDDLKSKFTI